MYSECNTIRIRTKYFELYMYWVLLLSIVEVVVQKFSLFTQHHTE